MNQEENVLVLRVEGLDCPECAASLEKAVGATSGVAAARLAFSTATLFLTPDDGADPLPAVQSLAKKMGYEVLTRDVHEKVQPQGWRAKVGKHRRDISTILTGALMLWSLSS